MIRASRLVVFDPPSWREVRVTTIMHVAMIGLLVGNLGRIPVFSTGDRDAPILLNDLLVGIVLCAGALNAVRRRALQLDSVALFALTFAAVGGASTLLSIPRFGLTGFEALVSLAYLARWLFYFGIYVVLINALRSGDVVGLWRTLELYVLIFAAFGIVQSITMPDFAQLVYPDSRVRADWDPQGHRLVSSWLDPQLAGAFIMLTLLIELALISVRGRVPLWKPILLSVALLLTASRAGAVATVVGVAVIVATRGLSRRMLRISISLAVFAAVTTPVVLQLTGLMNKLHVDASAMQRVVAWTRAWRVLSEHPVIGIGFNAWGFVQERYGYERLYVFSYSLDGGLIFIALMSGALGLGLYIAMLTALIRRARRLWRNQAVPPEHRGLAVGTVAGTIALIVNSLFANALLLPYLMETMWVLWALVFAMAVAHRSPTRSRVTMRIVRMREELRGRRRNAVAVREST